MKIKIETKDGKKMIQDIDVTDWSEADRASLLQIVNETETATSEAAQIIADQKRLYESPAAVLARKQEEREEAIAAKAALERATIEELHWSKLVKEHGKKRLKRLPTKEGMVVVRCPTEEETVSQGLAILDIKPIERESVARDYLASMVIYPVDANPDKPEPVREIASKWPGLWEDLNYAVQMLQSSRADERRPFD
jgi:hypothetical protein